MATITHVGSGKKVSIPDGQLIRDVCEQELDIPFSCKDGICGTCKIKIIDGMSNLSPKNDKEIDMGIEKDQRLACQTKIKSGNVKIDNPY